MFSFPRLGDGRRRLLRRLPKKAVGAEVGVWKGEFSERLLAAAQPGELHLVDPWHFVSGFPKRWYGGLKAKNQLDMDAIHQAVVDKFARYSHVSVHRQASVQSAATFPDGYFDWVYIDGDHSFEAVYADLAAWCPKVRSGGLLAGDDYNWKDEADEAAVRKAVLKFSHERSLKTEEIGKEQFVITA